VKLAMEEEEEAQSSELQFQAGEDGSEEVNLAMEEEEETQSSEMKHQAAATGYPYRVIGSGSCRSANVHQYTNHYLQIGSHLTQAACVAKCNADIGCTHMEWGINGHRQKQCVIFSPQRTHCAAPPGWTFVPGNGGKTITKGNGWQHFGPVTCSAKIFTYRVIGAGSCRSANVHQYPNHYVKIGHTLTHSACKAQCNLDMKCGFMEWGINGHRQKQCVIFPATHLSAAPPGWTFVRGNGGATITRGNGWQHYGPVTCSAKVVPTSYRVLDFGSCRSANLHQYPNHYLKIGHVTQSQCEAQCKADPVCTHMEWGLNGHHQPQCVIFPTKQPNCVPPGWRFVPGNGGTAITRGNRWSPISKCYTKV